MKATPAPGCHLEEKLQNMMKLRFYEEIFPKEISDIMNRNLNYEQELKYGKGETVPWVIAVDANHSGDAIPDPHIPKSMV